MADLYSLRGQEPEPLPARVRLPDGLTVHIKEGEELNQALLKQAGWTGPHEKPGNFDSNTHKCAWSAEDLAFVVVEKNSIELRNARNSAEAQMRINRNAELDQSDKRIMPWLEKGLPAPEAWQKYRQALRDLPGTTEDPFRVLWPREPLPHEVDDGRPETEQATSPKPRQSRRRKTT